MLFVNWRLSTFTPMHDKLPPKGLIHNLPRGLCSSPLTEEHVNSHVHIALSTSVSFYTIHQTHNSSVPQPHWNIGGRRRWLVPENDLCLRKESLVTQLKGNVTLVIASHSVNHPHRTSWCVAPKPHGLSLNPRLSDCFSLSPLWSHCLSNLFLLEIICAHPYWSL